VDRSLRWVGLLQLFVRLRESSKPLIRQTLNKSPDVTSGNADTQPNPLILDDMDDHSIDTAAVGGIVNVEFTSVDFGRESVDVGSLQADEDTTVDADAADVDDLSSSAVSDHVSQAASSSAVLLAHYKVMMYFLLVCYCL